MKIARLATFEVDSIGLEKATAHKKQIAIDKISKKNIPSVEKGYFF